jgi:F0F1-type ATP synthase assembly protein I
LVARGIERHFASVTHGPKWFFCAMSSLAARNRRVVLRFVGVQAAVTLALAGLLYASFGRDAAAAALAGGTVIASGNALFGWRLFAPGVAPVRVLARAFYRAELLKWLWIGGGLWLALGLLALPPLGVLAGVVVAQFGFWLALWRAS